MKPSTKAEFAAAYTGIMGVAVVNVLPALAGVLTTDLHWNEQTIGRFASADSIGALVGTLLAAALLKRHSFRALTVAGMVILGIADAASGFFHGVAPLMIARLLGSVGGGLAMGISFAVFASSRPERGMALWSIGQLIFGFIAITTFPRLAAALGLAGAFFLLAALIVPALAASRHLPAERIASVAEGSAPHPADVIGKFAWIGIIGVAIFFIGVGVVWPYLEVIGLASGIDPKSVERSLSMSSASALVGSSLVLLTENRLGHKFPLLFTFALIIAAISCIRSTDPVIFRAALAAITFSWPVFSAYQFAVLVAGNHSGRIAAFVTSANFAGLAIGPLLAGEFIATWGFGGMQWLAFTMAGAALLSLVPLMRGTRSHTLV